MSYRLGYLGFNFTIGVPLDYLAHGSGRWDCVPEIYSLEMDLKGPILLKLYVMKKKKKELHI